MRTTKQMSITVPLEMADMVRANVDSGEYASESEVIREGLRALAERVGSPDRPGFLGRCATLGVCVLDRSRLGRSAKMIQLT